MKISIRDAASVSAAPGGIQIDRKRLQQLWEKKVAMGGKPDDRENQTQTWGCMTMG